jgi:hypothetical protein
MVTVLRPLSTSELLDRTFHLYRNNFLMFVGIAAIPQLFVLALQLGGAAMMMGQQGTRAILLILVGYLLFYVAVYISQAPTIVAVSNLYLEKPVSIGSSYSSARRSLPRVIWIVFLIFLAMVAIFGLVGVAAGALIGVVAAASGPTWGTIVAVVVITPAIILAIRWLLNWSLVIPVTVLEGGWFRVSIRRSKTLAKGNRFRIFVVFFLMGLFTAVASFTIQFLLLLPLQLLRLRDLHTIQAATQGVQAIGTFISTSLVGALGTIALSLIYYDQRVRKEGLDLQLMMSTLESSGPADAGSLVIANTGT